MARLILEDGDQRRAFRIKEGKFTVGSGEGCTLRLSSPGVAEIHAELELKGGVATLYPRPGVMPAQLGSRAISEPTPLPDGSELTIGEAHLKIDYEVGASAQSEPAVSAGAPARAVKGQARGAPAAARQASSAPTGRAANAPSEQDKQRRSVVQRQRRTIERGMPAWLLLVLLAVGAGAAFLLVRGMLSDMGEEKVLAGATFDRAVRDFNAGNYENAANVLAKIDVNDPSVSDALREQVRELEVKLKGKTSDSGLDADNRKGTSWMDTQLKRFVNERLQGDPQREWVRVFLKRCREFRERWPQHPDLDWVIRYETRYKGLVDLSEPPTFADLAVEVKTLTWAMPRSYKKAFAVIDDFLRNASEEEREQALGLIERLHVEREEYFTDRMLQAKYHWEKEETGKSVSWLVELIIGVDDANMELKATKELVLLPGIGDWYESYEQHQPEKFEALTSHPLIVASQIAERVIDPDSEGAAKKAVDSLVAHPKAAELLAHYRANTPSKYAALAQYPKLERLAP